MEEIIQWVVIGAFWLITTLIRKGRENKQSESSHEPTEVPSALSRAPEQELAQAHALSQHVQAMEEWLQTASPEDRWGLPLVRDVLQPNVDLLMMDITMAIENPSLDTIFSIQNFRIISQFHIV